MKAIQIVIPSENPAGMKIAYKPGWNGRCLIVPRQRIKELKDVTDSDRPGLYFLFGQGEETGQQLAYIGESENFYARITSHDAKKDFWDTAVIFIGELNRAYVKYLEHQATTLAREAKRMEMLNVVQPQINKLSDYDKVAADEYFEQMKFILSTLSYEIFEPLDKATRNAEIYFLNRIGLQARAKLLANGNMLVLAGSQASTKPTASFEGWAKLARSELIKEGILVPSEDGRFYIFSTDYLFRKPSPAAAVIAARSINGWTAWKDAKGLTLDQNVRQ